MSTIALPRDIAAAVVVSGLSTAMRAVALGGMVLTIVMSVDVVLAHGLDPLSAPLVAAPAVVLLLLAALLLLLPSRATAALYLGGGAIAAAASVVVVVTLAEQSGDPFILNRVATALPLVGALGGSARNGVRWTLAAVVTAYAALAAGWWAAAGAIGPLGYGPLIVGVVALTGFGLLAAVRHRAKQRVPEFLAVQRAVLVDERERELQRRAAAAVHDTVLADLAAVSITSGRVDERMRDHILRDLDAIVRPTARREPTGAPDSPSSTRLADALLDLADRYRWSGVSVQLSGADELDVDVPETIVEALVGATRAALDNVSAHAGTGQAELVVGHRDDAIAVLVVDAGRGFDPGAVGADRLGLRESIDGRIRAIGGTVRIWSGDEGTTVMMRVPLGAVDG
ncbi:MAG: sensor histidine kinase [Microcella sp.]